MTRNDLTGAPSPVPARYHPLLVLLHWLIALLILSMLGMGFLLLAPMPNTDSAKAAILKWHMAGGIAVFGLMLVRLVLRRRTARPAPATAGSRALDRLAWLNHAGFYVVTLLLAASGIVTARLSGLPAILFGGSRAPLPPTFGVYPSFKAHAVLAAALLVMAGAHVLAALYHQIILRDALIGRMSFGTRFKRFP